MSDRSVSRPVEPGPIEPRPIEPGPIEMVDIVDADDNVVATVSRRRMRAERLRHRSVAVAVLSSTGRLLVHRRSDGKDLWPGGWDVCVGGVVAAGETYAQAARRELAEEVGVQAIPRQIGMGTYVDDDVATIGRWFDVVNDGPFTFDDGEVVEVRWVDAAELAAMRRCAGFVPDSTTCVLPLLDLA